VGSVAVLVSWFAGSQELEHIFREIDPAVVLTNREGAEVLRDKVRAHRAQVVCVDELRGRDFDARIGTPSHVNPDDVAAYIFTGGTTGLPKATVHTHAGLMKAVHAQVSRLRSARAKPRSDAPPNLIALPLVHLSGLMSLLLAVAVQRPIVLMSKFEVKEFLQLASAHKIDNFFGTPTMLHMLANSADDEVLELPNLRFAISGAAPLTEETRLKFLERFGIPVLQSYGSTETTHIAGWDPRDLGALQQRPTSVGRPYDHVKVQVRDDSGAELGPNDVGEIWVNSPSAMMGYAFEEESDVVINRGWVATGDLGYLDDEGYLFVVDRKKEIIICGGFNIFPAELERVLARHPSVSEAVVVGVPDQRLGELPIAVIVPVGDADPDDIIAFVRGQVPHYRAIRGVQLVASLPTGDALKHQRASIRAEAAARAGLG
jgi:long-chain acyl-CoA synthetase